MYICIWKHGLRHSVVKLKSLEEAYWCGISIRLSQLSEPDTEFDVTDDRYTFNLHFTSINKTVSLAQQLHCIDWFTFEKSPDTFVVVVIYPRWGTWLTVVAPHHDHLRGSFSLCSVWAQVFNWTISWTNLGVKKPPERNKVYFIPEDNSWECEIKRWFGEMLSKQMNRSFHTLTYDCNVTGLSLRTVISWPL